MPRSAGYAASCWAWRSHDLSAAILAVFVNLVAGVLKFSDTEITENGAHREITLVAKAVPFATRRENDVAGLHGDLCAFNKVRPLAIEDIEKFVRVVVLMQEMGSVPDKCALPDHERT